MPCYRPMHGYRSRERTEKGKRKIVFSPKEAYTDLKITIPCGQCIGCRLEKSRQWAIRCVYESQMYDENCFLTLTYDNENYPKDHSLHKKDIQKFMKRLRKTTNKKIKYYHCGEYGDDYQRPHYHMCMFNYDFQDKEIHNQHGDFTLYTSEKCNKLWGKGYVILGDVTFDSAAYVARYITKKINKNKDQYTKVNILDGHVYEVEPEYSTCSHKIGNLWFDKYKDDVYPHDYVVINGKKIKPPKHFDKLLEERNELEYLQVKRERLNVSDDFEKENERDRLLAREKFKKLQLNKTLTRNYEND